MGELKAMRIGVISDSHGHVANTRAAVQLLGTLDVEQVLHCGDIDMDDIPGLIAPWPAHFVFGNCDRRVGELRQAILAAGHTCHERFGKIELAGRKIALLHSDDLRQFQTVQTNGEYDLVCYGHTHEAEYHRVERTLVLNPGALYRATPHTLAVVDLQTMQATILPIR
jgi:putative phosphoesterase